MLGTPEWVFWPSQGWAASTTVLVQGWERAGNRQGPEEEEQCQQRLLCRLLGLLPASKAAPHPPACKTPGS